MRHDTTHGGALDRIQAQFPDAPHPWIDLSTGINPWSYRGFTLDEAAFDRLPTESAYVACRDAMAEAFKAPARSVILSPGSELLIRLLPGWLTPHRVAVFSPTYGDHAEVWQQAGCEVIETDAPLAHADEVDLVVLCNPNNPDGRIFAREDMLTACDRLASKGGWLIVDEAYGDLTPDLSLTSQGGRDGLIILRSFGKFFGLPGIRLGALIAPPVLVAQASQQLGAWPVSSGALEMGAAAYRDHIWHNDTRARLQLGRAMLDRVLEENGVYVVGGTDLFRHVRVEDAERTWLHLARAGIYVRRFDAVPRHLRIGLPADEIALARLNEALSLLE